MAEVAAGQVEPRRRKASGNGAGSSSIRCLSSYERVAREQGYTSIAGVDEVGRGCLFGPVMAAAVILNPLRPIRGLHDSKILDAGQREELAAADQIALYLLGGRRGRRI